jgi:hypothetical protein
MGWRDAPDMIPLARRHEKLRASEVIALKVADIVSCSQAAGAIDRERVLSS